MSNASDITDAQPLYPSFEELFSARKPFPEGISVIEDKHSPKSLTPYYLNGTFHSISQEPSSTPKISSVTVAVMKLDHWETGWLERHDKHYDGGVIGRTLGTLNDYDPEEDSDKEEHLLSYCEESRPRGKKVKVVVRHASGDFVTVHDYLSTVHPWLMSLKGESEAAPNSLFEEFSIVDFMIERAASNAALQASAFTPPTIRNQTYPFFGPHPAPQPGQPQPPTQYLPLYG